MKVVIRLDMTDDRMRAFKDQLGIKPTRKAVVAEINKMLDRSLFPDGPPKTKKKKFTLRG